MSNNSSAFRIQSYGTSSVFDPNQISEAYESENVVNSNYFDSAPIRSSGPVVASRDSTQVYFFAIKFDPVNKTVVSKIVFELRGLVFNSSEIKLSLAFYSKTQGGIDCDGVKFERIGDTQNISLTNNIVVNGGSFLTIELTKPNELPPIEISGIYPIPLYLGLKLVENTTDDWIILNGESNNSTIPCINSGYIGGVASNEELQSVYGPVSLTSIPANPVIYLL
jgi:hypothetical protein